MPLTMLGTFMNVARHEGTRNVGVYLQKLYLAVAHMVSNILGTF